MTEMLLNLVRLGHQGNAIGEVVNWAALPFLASKQHLNHFLEVCNPRIPEVVLYSSFLVTVVLLLLGLNLKGIREKKRFFLWVLLLEYVFLVVSSTIVFRAPRFPVRFELIPFWTYYAIANHDFGVSIWDIVLNIVLFVPLGILISSLFPSFSFKKVVLLGLAFSLCIELSQFFWARGIAQFDDLMHNSLGCFLGFCIVRSIKNRCK